MHYPDLRSRFSLFEPRALVPRPYYYAPAIPPSIGFSNTVRGHSIAADKRPNNPRIVTPMNGGKEPRARVNRGCQGLRESASMRGDLFSFSFHRQVRQSESGD